MSAVPVNSQPAGVDAVMAKVKEIAVLPQVVFKIMEMTASTASSAQMLEQSIIIDPGFSARILAQTNSAYYALPRKVSSIREAVMFLGFKAVRQLAMTVGVFDLFVGKTDAESLRRRMWWRHSIDTAVCCKSLADMLGAGESDEAYTCGLLHYIGKTLMDRSAPAEYTKVMMLMDKGVMDIQAERAVFKCDHVDVTIAAGRKWGFPEKLINCFDYTHEPSPDDPNARTKAIVALGDRIAKIAVGGQTALEAEDLENLPQWATSLWGASAEKQLDMIRRGKDAIATAAKLGF